MMYLAFKTIVTALVVVAISELSRRYSLIAAALASLPLVSILAFIWIYVEEKSPAKLIGLSQEIFWLVLPSLAFFLIFPGLLKLSWSFWPAMLVSCVSMAVLYAFTLWLLKTFA